MPLMYEQLEEEGPRAFEAFVIYRDMGLGRNLESVSKQVDKNMSMIRRWSAEYNWVARCRAWDAEQDRVKREAQTREIVEMAKRHAAIAVRLQEKLVRRLQDLDPMELTPKEVSTWLETAVKIERLSRGVSTDSVRQEVVGADGGAVELSVVQKPPTAEEMAEVMNTLIQSGVITDVANNLT